MDTTSTDLGDDPNQKLIHQNYNYSVIGIGNSIKDDDTSNSGISISGKSQPIEWTTDIPQQAPTQDVNIQRDGLTATSIWGYAVGHFDNDLVAGLGFTYQLYYLQEIVKLSQVNSGFTILSGQITDGLTTPLIGMASDSCNTRIGKRAPWYIVGTFLVIPSFIGIFVYPPLEGDAQIAYYIILPAVLNVGWAFVQISNMSVVNSLSASTQRRDRLISLRNGFSYLANTLVLVSALIVFSTVKDQILQFRILCLMLGGLGFCTSLYYVLAVREPFLTAEAKRLQKQYLQYTKTGELKETRELEEEEEEIDRNPRTSSMSQKITVWYQWLSEGQFYIYGMAYMLVRVAVNVTMSVQPFYLINVTGFIKTEENPTPLQLALVPLISFITQSIFSLFFYKKMMERFQNRQAVLLASVIVLALGSIPLIILDDDENVRWLVYLLSPIQGLGLAICLNTATSLISDVIGKSESNSAFVYGAYGFFDKVANGVGIFFITAYLNKDPTALRFIVGLTPPLCGLFAYLACMVGHRKYANRLAALSMHNVKRKKSKSINKK
ncbi:UNKNOWN [Stylonychia lemnae]|uniref:Major facilitator superfamily protein n=1 Tax=Stylonychia lemnae TaxID=5949 RepID=A0A078B8C1_STYLE|nr:UNKNOWN [Stylonychia lemnae]|eukprot:CDW90654.1 UNKNOWN [Stylonychia lemnae]